MKFLLGGLLVYLVFVALPVYAQEAYEELQAILKAEVVGIIGEREERIMGTNATATVQTVEARIKEGETAGEVVRFENDLVMLSTGDQIFLTHVRTIDGFDIYIIKDVSRQFSLLVLFFLFVATLLVFAGFQGLRAMISLFLSIGAIVFILLPALLKGYDPILSSLFIAGAILALVLFLTHGVNSLSVTAFIGTLLAVLATSAIAWIFTASMRFTGFGSDASVYLNFATNGSLDLPGLLLGSIIIGILGVLDDVSITQASVVRELRIANENLGVYELYQRALRVGRDHVGALVNTLAFAYIGAALPLVLLFSTSEFPISFTLNQEVIASELTRIIIGSMGLILAVPLTTIIAAWWFKRYGIDHLEHISPDRRHHH